MKKILITLICFFCGFLTTNATEQILMTDIYNGLNPVFPYYNYYSDQTMFIQEMNTGFRILSNTGTILYNSTGVGAKAVISREETRYSGLSYYDSVNFIDLGNGQFLYIGNYNRSSYSGYHIFMCETSDIENIGCFIVSYTYGGFYQSYNTAFHLSDDKFYYRYTNNGGTNYYVTLDLNTKQVTSPTTTAPSLISFDYSGLTDNSYVKVGNAYYNTTQDGLFQHIDNSGVKETTQILTYSPQVIVSNFRIATFFDYNSYDIFYGKDGKIYRDVNDLGSITTTEILDTGTLTSIDTLNLKVNSFPNSISTADYYQYKTLGGCYNGDCYFFRGKDFIRDVGSEPNLISYTNTELGGEEGEETNDTISQITETDIIGENGIIDSELFNDFTQWYDVYIEEEPTLALNIPYVKLHNGFHFKIEHKAVPLPLIEDRLGVSQFLDEESAVGKKFLSFLLAIFYIFIRLFIISGIFFIFRLYFGAIRMFVKSLIGDHIIPKGTGNIWTWITLGAFLVLVGSTFISLFTYILPFTSLINDVVDKITVIFCYLNASFFDFGTFRGVVNTFFFGFIPVVISYILYAFMIHTGRIN